MQVSRRAGRLARIAVSIACEWRMPNGVQLEAGPGETVDEDAVVFETKGF